MLVLTRRAGESIVIGDEVRVVVLDVRGDTVRLGIEAPRSIQVHRAEVYAEVQAANAAAVSRVEDLASVAGRLQRIARTSPSPSHRDGHAADGAAAPDPDAPADGTGDRPGVGTVGTGTGGGAGSGTPVEGAGARHRPQPPRRFTPPVQRPSTPPDGPSARPTEDV